MLKSMNFYELNVKILYQIKGKKLESVKVNLGTRLHEGSLISDVKLVFWLNCPDVSFNSLMLIAALTKYCISLCNAVLSLILENSSTTDLSWCHVIGVTVIKEHLSHNHPGAEGL